MSGVRLGLLVPLGLALELAWPSTAQADDAQAVELVWSAPAAFGCPDAGYALAELRRYVGTGRQQQRPIQARVVVQGGDRGKLQLVLRTELANAQGERTLRDVSCTALVDAAVVILAWMVDPQKMAARTPATPPPPGEPPVPAPAPKAPPKVASSTHRRRALEPFLDLSVALDVGTLPRAAFGGEALAGIALMPLRWSMYGAYWPAVERTLGALADARAVGGNFTLFAFGVKSCLETPLAASAARMRWGACVGPEVDLLRGESFGVNRGGAGQKVWLAALGEVNARLQLSGYACAVLRASSIVPTLRENFALRGVGLVHQPAAAAFRGALGIELQF